MQRRNSSSKQARIAMYDEVENMISFPRMRASDMRSFRHIVSDVDAAPRSGGYSSFRFGFQLNGNSDPIGHTEQGDPQRAASSISPTMIWLRDGSALDEDSPRSMYSSSAKKRLPSAPYVCADKRSELGLRIRADSENSSSPR